MEHIPPEPAVGTSVSADVGEGYENISGEGDREHGQREIVMPVHNHVENTLV
jgi:hypothetical protein